MAVSARTRVRGFASWNPQADTRRLLKQVDAILAEYAAYLPLTIRQIFYRLVGVYAYEKTFRAYKNLAEYLNRARRAELIPFEHIRDDGIIAHRPPGWASVDDLIQTFQHAAANFTLDRQQGQPRRLIIMCEAGGMVPQLERVAHPYSIEVMSKGGFDSTTGKHAVACKLAYGSTEVLHIGDHDHSGVHIYSALEEDVKAFAAELGGEVEFTRLAVTEKQVERLALPIVTGKLTDRRSFPGINGDAMATVQVEAIAPDDLARIVLEAIDDRNDHGAYQSVLNAENDAKAQLAGWLGARP